MAAPWKMVLIGGEITVLAAFTGVGVHLAMQPQRHTLAPPPSLLLPAAVAPAATARPRATTPAIRPAVTPTATPLSADWIAGLGRADRHLVTSQWKLLEGLMHGIERYLRDRVVPDLEHRR